MTTRGLLPELHELLSDFYGVDSRWWPGASRLEIAVGAVLVQRTTWRQAAKALERLRQASLLRVETLASIAPSRLARLIRPAGFPQRKAKTIRALAELVRRCGGDVERFAELEDPRGTLLGVPGIGEETADAILLFGADYPTFPASAYLRRTLNRVGVNVKRYRELRELVMKSLPQSVEAYKVFHASVVTHAKQVCKANPLCERCPANSICRYYRQRKTDA